VVGAPAAAGYQVMYVGVQVATLADIGATVLLTVVCGVLVFSPWLAPLAASGFARLARSRRDNATDGDAPTAEAPAGLPLAGEEAVRERLYRPARVSSWRGDRSPRRLRIAMLAPPWIEVPPPGYGGIELVVAQLTDALAERGHEVTLFAAPGSRSQARVVSPLERSYPRAIGQALEEADHVASALAAIEADSTGYDLIHDHSGFVALAFADRLRTPLLHTLHGPFDERTYGFYRRHGHKAPLVAISAAQLRTAPPGLRVVGVIPNPLRTDEWPFAADKDDYLLWIGRMAPVKGPHRAIAAARRAGRPLVLAGPVQPGQEQFFAEEVEPHIDGESVRYVGEVGGVEKQRLFARASALLMPIRWPEPFGMVMIEALACGTPVIAFAEGAATEIVTNGETGFLVADEEAMAAAVGRLDEIDPARCREVVRERFDVARVAEAYESAYRLVVAGAGVDTSVTRRPPTRTPRSSIRSARSHTSASVRAPAEAGSRPISTRTTKRPAPAAHA